MAKSALDNGCLVKWYEEYADGHGIIKDAGFGLIVEQVQHHPDYYRVYRTKHEDVLCFHNANLEKLNNE